MAAVSRALRLVAAESAHSAHSALWWDYNHIFEAEGNNSLAAGWPSSGQSRGRANAERGGGRQAAEPQCGRPAAGSAGKSRRAAHAECCFSLLHDRGCDVAATCSLLCATGPSGGGSSDFVRLRPGVLACAMAALSTRKAGNLPCQTLRGVRGVVVPRCRQPVAESSRRQRGMARRP